MDRSESSGKRISCVVPGKDLLFRFHGHLAVSLAAVFAGVVAFDGAVLALYGGSQKDGHLRSVGEINFGCSIH